MDCGHSSIFTLSPGGRACENYCSLWSYFSKGCDLQVQTSAAAYRKYMCVICGFIYDEALGCPQDGIEPGTRWEDVPETWCCPDCGANKADFELLED